MASKNSHAACQTERSFAVRVLPEQGKPTELAAGVGDYLEAVDLATEWLERTDPKRTGTTPIEIVESRDGGEATVWEYPPANRPPTLVDIFGFDPVGWVSAVQDFKAERRHPTPAPPLRVVGPRPPVSPPLQPQPEPQPALARVPTRRREAVPFLHSLWTDPVSRACVIVCALALWLTVALVDATFLALLVPALTGLWWRRSHRAEASAEAPTDDDLL
jgi:hypothetical protein